MPGATTGRAAEDGFVPKLKRLIDGPTPTPTPRRKRRHPAAEKEKDKKPTPKATPPSKPSETPPPTETPAPTVTTTPIPNPSSTPAPEAPSVPPSPTSSPIRQKNGPPNATVSPSEIIGSEKWSPEVRKLLERALELTRQNLDYTYGSSDPAKGGMDCSGFINFVLAEAGLRDVPRDASEQYVWVRKAGAFQAVLSRNDSSFELDALAPGDLLFWTGTYNIERDPPVTHIMIYLGRKKGSNHRIMVGASDGRTYEGQQRFGVSVFDFKLARAQTGDNSKPTPSFVGYAQIPGLTNKE